MTGNSSLLLSVTLRPPTCRSDSFQDSTWRCAPFRVWPQLLRQACALRATVRPAVQPNGMIDTSEWHDRYSSAPGKILPDCSGRPEQQRKPAVPQGCERPRGRQAPARDVNDQAETDAPAWSDDASTSGPRGRGPEVRRWHLWYLAGLLYGFEHRTGTPRGQSR